MAYKILIAEDEKSIRQTLHLILKNDYQLEIAEGGQEALQKALANDYDLILLDLKMPDMNGLEVLKKIKAQKPQVKAVIMTGYYQEYRDMEKEIGPLVKGVIFKPVEIDELKNKIKEFLA